MKLPSRAILVIVTMTLAQLPVAMRHLLLVLLGHDKTGSYAAAGAASAACGIGLALTAPLTSRLLSRIGHRPVLLSCGFVHTATLVALTLTADTVVFVVLSAFAGLATPPVLSSGRALLPALVPAPALSRAYALNAIGQEFLYIGGPLAVTLSVAVASPGVALLCFALIGAGGLLANTAAIPRAGRPDRRADRGPSAARRPPVRTLVGVHLGYMVGIGSMWVLLPAFSAGAGHPEQAGLLVTVWSLGSLAGALLLARRGRRGSLIRAYLALLAVLAVTSMGLPLPRTVPQMAVAVALFGLALAPWLATVDELMAHAAPAPHTAEGYGWMQTVGQLGVAAGAATSGWVSDEYGTTAAFLIVSTALTLSWLVALRRRRTLRDATAEADTAPACADPVVG